MVCKILPVWLKYYMYLQQPPPQITFEPAVVPSIPPPKKKESQILNKSLMKFILTYVKLTFTYNVNKHILLHVIFFS